MIGLAMLGAYQPASGTMSFPTSSRLGMADWAPRRVTAAAPAATAHGIAPPRELPWLRKRASAPQKASPAPVGSTGST